MHDQIVSAKTRGSAQRAFAQALKSNYNWRCAITGISKPDFLVASHIVPWSKAPGIRLDPRNGICLSTFVDRAFDTGYLRVGPDYVVRIDWVKVGDDGVAKGCTPALRWRAFGDAIARRPRAGLPPATPCQRIHREPLADRLPGGLEKDEL
ncbi:HNH endonuclease [Paenarthrobacter sp. NPDC057981]|uniref:HNH endonuclease n=1 Tax=Paenarthrobacter sp. NPDC057981 TaxID=3346297 RepID=UPI0036D95E9A